MKEGINSFNIILPNGQKGRNLLSNRPEDWEQGNVNDKGERTTSSTRLIMQWDKGLIAVKANEQYTITISSNFRWAIRYFDENQNHISGIWWFSGTNTITTPSNANYVRFVACRSDNKAILPTVIGADCKIMFEEGDTAHDWDYGTTRGVIQTIVTSDARLTQELMTSDQIELSWTDSEWQVIPAGSYIMYYGEKYTLLEPYQPEQRDEVYYDYKPKFVAEQFTWEKYPFFLYTPQTATDGTEYVLREPSWTLTDEPKNFMNLIVEAIKRETGETWTAETVKDGYEQGSATLTFEDTDILSALNSIADAFGSEWFVDKATKTIWLKTALVTFEGENPYYPLRVGQNVAMPSISNNKEDKYYNRYVVFGSSRNIVQDAQLASSNTIVNRRLTLDPTKYPEGYIDAEQNPTHVYTKILYFEDIYPHADLKVANVLRHTKNKDESNKTVDEYSVYYFRLIDGNTGTDLAFDPTTYDKEKNPSGNLISGLTLSINFKTGSLRGREFEMEYLTAPRNCQNVDKSRFTVPKGYYCVKFIEENGFVIPSEGIRPKDGDEVILFNCRMPDSYVTTAQKELEAAALKEVANYEQDTASYTVDSYADAFRMAAVDLTIGSAVSLDRTLRGTLLSRVTKIERSIDLPYVQTITVGNQRIKGAISTLKEQVAMQEASLDEVTKVAHSVQRGQQNLPRQFADIMETTDALVDAKLDGYDEKITPIAVQTMQTVVGDESLQFRFVENFEKLEAYWENPTENPLKEVYLDAVWDKDAQSWSIMTAYLQHMTYGVGAMTGQSGAAKARRQWVIGKYDSGALTETDKRYYLYAVVDIYDNENENYGEGHFELSEEAHELHEEDGYLWLLVGILSAETDGNRSFARMYGYTEILPGRITTDKIVSDDGETYFDLKSGEIGGNIKFNAGNKAEIKTIVDEAVGELASEHPNLLALCRLQKPKYGIESYDALEGWVTHDLDYPWNDDRDFTDITQADWRLTLEAGTYTITQYASATKTNYIRAIVIASDGTEICHTLNGGTAAGTYSKTFTINERTEIGVYHVGNKSTNGIIRYKLEKGDTSSDWCLSEDDTKNDYLRNSLEIAASGTTDITGGLVLSNFIGVRKTDGTTVTAGMNGNADLDLPMIFAGRDDTYANGTTQIWKDGRIISTDGTNEIRMQGHEIVFSQDGNVKNIITSASGKSIPDMMEEMKSGGGPWSKAFSLRPNDKSTTEGELNEKEVATDAKDEYVIVSNATGEGTVTINSFTLYAKGYAGGNTTYTPTTGGDPFQYMSSIQIYCKASLYINNTEKPLVSKYFNGSANNNSAWTDGTATYSGNTFSFSNGATVKVVVTTTITATITSDTDNTTIGSANVSGFMSINGGDGSSANIGGSYTIAAYHNQTYADSMILSSSTTRYFGIDPQARQSGVLMEARMENHGFRLTSNGLMQGSWLSGQWTRMNMIIYVGYLRPNSNGGYTVSSWFNPTNRTFACDKGGTGLIKITHNIGHNNYSVFGTSLDRDTPKQIAAAWYESTSFYIGIADDSSRNDGECCFMIIDRKSYQE